MQRPKSTDYFEYYDTYVRLVPDVDFLKLASQQIGHVRECIGHLSESEASMTHAPYTWTIKQVLGHLIDTERIFADRFHRIACGEEQALPGYEQNDYVKNLDYDVVSLSSLLDEFELCRKANLLLFRRIPEVCWERQGTASGHPVTIRALAFMMVGHVIYHENILKKRLSG
jgi:hypothetical protein